MEVNPSETPADCGLPGQPGGPLFVLYVRPRGNPTVGFPPDNLPRDNLPGGVPTWESVPWPSQAGMARFKTKLCSPGATPPLPGIDLDRFPEEADFEYCFKFWAWLGAPRLAEASSLGSEASPAPGLGAEGELSGVGEKRRSS